MFPEMQAYLRFGVIPTYILSMSIQTDLFPEGTLQ